MKILLICFFINVTSSLGELILWKYKSKQFLQLNEHFERKCEVNRLLTAEESISWILYNHHGDSEIIQQSNLIIRSFTIEQEGIAICQVKDRLEQILDEKYFFLTSDPTDLIDERFEGSEQILIDSEINQLQRHCGPDKDIEFNREDIADFHIDFVQHFERVRYHTNHIEIPKIKHEHEGYYECIVRLHNGLVGVRVLFLSVGGGPRQISNRETHFYSEVNDSITLLCPIFSALPAWYTFITPDNSNHIGHDYLRLKHLTSAHSGLYQCRVTTNDDSEGYSLTANIHLDVYGPPEYVKPYLQEYNLISLQKHLENVIRCSIDGNPPPIYQWFLGDVEKKNRKAILAEGIDYVIIPNEDGRIERNQTVTCFAENNRGIQRQVFLLQIRN